MCLILGFLVSVQYSFDYKTSKKAQSFMIFCLPSVGSLIHQCYDSTKKNRLGRCNKYLATYDYWKMKNTSPLLQSLTLFGVKLYCNDSKEPIKFPWTNKSMSLPLNMTRSSYEQSQFTGGVIKVPSFQFMRIFV